MEKLCYLDAVNNLIVARDIRSEYWFEEKEWQSLREDLTNHTITKKKLETIQQEKGT
jgi:hypothetical protein